MSIRAVWLCVLFSLAACGRGYSDGDRTGTVVKFSRKGLLCKSWEGEMNLGGIVSGVDGTSAVNVWHFTVADEALVPSFQSAMASGKRVMVHYQEWAAGPVCNESAYEATSVTVAP